MCRLLVNRFKTAQQPALVLRAFAQMSRQSKALDGDWQGDGWGVAWIDQEGMWQRITSLAPIWEEQHRFEEIPITPLVMAHARSASFPHHKGVLEFNQPYLHGKYAFTFNGLLKGVSLPNIPGRIGAEKIWHLLKQELESHEPKAALERVKQLLQSNTEEIVALNIGLASPDQIYSLNLFSRHPEYYTLHRSETERQEMICSEKINEIS